LPLDLCVCNTLTREGAVKRIKIYTAKAKFKKFITIVEGIEKSQLKTVFQELKSRLACGGSLKDGQIMLQGEHKKKVKEILLKMGYKENMIEVGE